MDPVANPYRPGAGRRPPFVAGRESLLGSFDIVRRRAETFGEGDRSWVLNGLRGVGKTVLLNEILGQVSDRGWIAAKVEAGVSESLPVALSQSLVRATRAATGRHPEPRLRRLLGVLKTFTLKVDPSGGVHFGLEVEPIPGVADSGRFAEDLAALFEVLGETARDLGVGVLVLVDELQEAGDRDMRAINAAVHHIGQADVPLPVILVGAGLPSLPAQLANANSYAERLYDHRPVGLLSADAAAEALTGASTPLGVQWEPKGLDAAVEAAGGYPYLLQAIGKHVWDNSRTSVITTEDVEVGLSEARREVDDGLYRSRWERATPAQRELLRALARLGGSEPVSIAEIAQALGKARSSDVSVARTQLIKKGLTYSPERGLLAFTVPGMHDFIARQP